MVTYAKIKKACRQANWAALHATCCEYRVVVNKDGEVMVREYPEGHNGWVPGETTLKTYCYWPCVADYFPGDSPVDAITLNWAQGQYIENALEFDACECWEEYQKEKEV